MYDHFDAYVISNLVASCVLQAGWSAFAALTIRSFVPDTSTWTAVILYLVGILSSLIAFYAVSSFYQGTLYRLVSLPLALICLLVFSIWPGMGNVLYGWFFALF